MSEAKQNRQQLACDFIHNNYVAFHRLRFDEIAQKVQIYDAAEPQSQADGVGVAEEGYWRYLTNADINSMVCDCCQETGANITSREILTILNAGNAYIPHVHPLREYVLQLRPYTADQPDWIDLVASQVHVRDCALDRPAGCRSATPVDGRSAAPVDGRSAQVPVDGRSAVTVDGRSAAPVDRPAGCSITRESTASNASELQCCVSETIYSELSERSTASSASELNSADRLWRICFKKWFVAMVASWMRDDIVNHQVLVLIGKQGIFKTTWLERLMPPQLRTYACKLANATQLTKDDRLRIAEFGLISLDEIDSMNNRELNQLKSIITASDVNERAAYASTKERRVRLASFCASGNRRDFLTDITGNRRWLPFEVESIQNPFFTTLPYERMYAQAWALANDPTFSYWFDLEEIAVIEQHNQQFRDECNEEQLLEVYFAVPSTDASNAKFMTTAEISERLIYYGNIKKPISLSRLGVLLSQKGFLSVRRGNPSRRGWIVYERESQEVNSERVVLSKDLY